MADEPTKDRKDAAEAPGLSIIEKAKADAEARVRELEPMVAEYEELTAFLTKLAQPVQMPQPDAEPEAPAVPTPRADVDAALGRQGAGKKDKAPKKPRAGRKGSTADKAVAIIRETPGIGASEVAKQMGIKPNYLYRVLGDLEKVGTLKKTKTKYSIA